MKTAQFLPLVWLVLALGCTSSIPDKEDVLFQYPDLILSDQFSSLTVQGNTISLTGKSSFLHGEWTQTNQPETDLRILIAPKGPAPSSGALRIDTYSGTQVSGRRLTNTTGYQLPFEEEIGVLTEVRYLQEDAGSQMFLTEELMIKIRNDRYAALFVDLQIVRPGQHTLKKVVK
ncbi:MAG: hypothetical protein KBG02_14495 [Haliscomenobacter sp.]|nr:hypothetical protein [Haliscomenobacter sp.]MBP9078074.1 hypothetical protein [Haliscomenobacter sp.]MBP9873188.1 hypothetical protein [Haliscomenobacter sp.]